MTGDGSDIGKERRGSLCFYSNNLPGASKDQSPNPLHPIGWHSEVPLPSLPTWRAFQWPIHYLAWRRFTPPPAQPPFSKAESSPGHLGPHSILPFAPGQGRVLNLQHSNQLTAGWSLLTTCLTLYYPCLQFVLSCLVPDPMSSWVAPP